MEEAPENGKESSHSAHAHGMNEASPCLISLIIIFSEMPRQGSIAFTDVGKVEAHIYLMCCYMNLYVLQKPSS
jgi:hypothetical protein